MSSTQFSGNPIGVVIDEQSLTRAQHHRCQTLTHDKRPHVHTLRAFDPVWEVNQLGPLVVQRHVTDRHVQRLADRFAHQFDQRIRIKLGVERPADAVDGLQFAHTPLRLCEQARVIQRNRSKLCEAVEHFQFALAERSAFFQI